MTRRGILGWLAGLFGAAAVGRGAQSDDALALNRNLAEAMRAIPFERHEISGDQALAKWQELRDRDEGYPVVIGEDEELSFFVEQLELNPESAEAILAAAGAVEHPASLRKHRADEVARFKQWAKDRPDMADVEDDYQAPLGDWPKEPSSDAGLSIAFDFNGKPHQRVHIIVVPARHGYEVPAYLRWGGWNECPPPAIHVAALRSWEQDYGAELIGISHDVINLRVARRPTSREAALALADEQYLYCSDLIDQGIQTQSNLAAGLMAWDWWYFWWD